MANGLFEGQIRIVIPLEVEQRIDQNAPFAFSNAKGNKNRML